MEMFVVLALLVLIGAVADSHAALESPPVVYVPVETPTRRSGGCARPLAIALLLIAILAVVTR